MSIASPCTAAPVNRQLSFLLLYPFPGLGHNGSGRWDCWAEGGVVSCPIRPMRSFHDKPHSISGRVWTITDRSGFASTTYNSTNPDMRQANHCTLGIQISTRTSKLSLLTRSTLYSKSYQMTNACYLKELMMHPSIPNFFFSPRYFSTVIPMLTLHLVGCLAESLGLINLPFVPNPARISRAFQLLSPPILAKQVHMYNGSLANQVTSNFFSRLTPNESSAQEGIMIPLLQGKHDSRDLVSRLAHSHLLRTRLHWLQ